MKYLKNLAIPLVVLSMVVAIGLSVNSVQAEPCGCNDSDDMYAIATETPDATSNGPEVAPLPPAKSIDAPKPESGELKGTIPKEPSPCCGELPPKRGVEGIDVAEKDPRFIEMAKDFDPKSNEYDQCLNLFAFVITTSEKIQKAVAEGNEGEVEVWRSSIYEAIGYFRDLGIDPTPLSPEIKAAGCEILTLDEALTKGKVESVEQAPCKNCGSREEKIRGIRTPLPDLDEKTMKRKYDPRVVRVFEQSMPETDDVDVALQLLSYIVEAPEGYAKAMEADNTEEMELWKNVVSHVIKKFRYIVDLSEFTSEIAELDQVAGTDFTALLSEPQKPDINSPPVYDEEAAKVEAERAHLYDIPDKDHSVISGYEGISSGSRRDLEFVKIPSPAEQIEQKEGDERTPQEIYQQNILQTRPFGDVQYEVLKNRFEPGGILEDYKDKLEIKSERKRFVVHYKEDDNTNVAITACNMFYEAEPNIWLDIDTKIKQSADGSHYYNNTNFFKTKFPTDVATGWDEFLLDDFYMKSRPKKLAIYSTDGQLIDEFYPEPGDVEVSGDTIWYRDIYPDCDYMLWVTNAGLKSDYYLHSPNSDRDRVYKFVEETNFSNPKPILIQQIGDDLGNQIQLSEGDKYIVNFAPIIVFHPGDSLPYMLGKYEMKQDDDNASLFEYTMQITIKAGETEDVIVDPYKYPGGTGNSNGWWPYHIYYNYHRDQFLYDNSWLYQSGRVNHINFYVASYSYDVMYNSEEWLRSRSGSSYFTSTSWETVGTRVYGSSTLYVNNSGWEGPGISTFNFGHYTTEYHLQWSYRHQDGSWESSYSKYYYNGDSYNRQKGGQSDSSNPPGMGLVASVNYTRIGFDRYCYNFGSYNAGTYYPGTSWSTLSFTIDDYACYWIRYYLYSGYQYIFTFCQGGGSASWDTYLELYNSSGTRVTYNDDACGLQSEITYCPSSSGYYYLRIRGFSTTSPNGTSSTIAWNGMNDFAGPTSASASPSSYCTGVSTTLSASGGYGGDYYWTYGNRGTCGNYIGTGSSITWTPGVGSYHVYVERRGTFCGNSRGTTAYKDFWVYVYNQPTISISGGGGTVCWDGYKTLTASVSGGHSNTYQWQYWNGSSWVNISGATGSTYNAYPKNFNGGASTKFRCHLTCGTYNCNDPYSNEQWVYLYNNGTSQGTWVGGYDTNWDNCKNWGKGRVPTSSIAVTIPSGCSHYPVLTSTLGVGTSSYHYDCASLTINGGSVTGTSTSFDVYLYGRLEINSGTFQQNYSSSSGFNIYSGGKLQVDGGNCYIGSNSSYGYADIYVNNGGEVEVNGGTLRIDDILRVESDGTVDLNGGNTYVKYRGYGSSEHGFNLKSGGTLTMDGSSTNLYICGAYNTSSSYCGLYFDSGSNVTCNGGYIRFINGSGYSRNYYVNFNGKTARYVYMEASGYNVYTCGNMNCYQLRSYYGYFHVRNAVYASSHVYTYNAGRIYVDSSSGSLNGYYYYLNNTGGLYVSAGTCTCRGYFYKYNGAYAQFSGGTTNVYYRYDNYGTSGNTTVNGGTFNVGTASASSSYYFRNLNGILNVSSGIMDAGYYLYNYNGYSSNDINISGGSVYADNIPNYEGRIDHTGGTLTTGGYYREYDTACHYYGSGSATFYFNGNSYIRLVGTSASYFNDVVINAAVYMETGSTQNFDINGSFTINSGKSFDTNGRTMFVAKNWTNYGAFTHDNNIVRFDGSSNSTITGSTTFYELEVNKTSNSYWVKPASGTTLHITNLDVSHAGVFDATNSGLNIWTP